MRISKILSIILISLKLFFLEEALAIDAIKEVFTCLEKKEWQECESLATTCGDVVLTKIILSQKFLDLNYKNNSFAEIIKFIQSNPHWPQVNQLKVIAEQYLDYDTKPLLIVEWFNQHKPATGSGYKFYALASSALTQDSKKIAKIIKEGWAYGTFSSIEESEYLKSFKHILLETDYVNKIETDLWLGNIENAKKYMRYVKEGYKKNFLAQIAIINKSAASEDLFHKVPKAYYTDGLLFRYLDAKKKEPPTSKDIELFRKVRPNKIRSVEWCRLQNYYAREFIDHKDFVSSYQIISLPIAAHAEGKREAEWFSGWLALSFLKKPDLALGHFHAFMKIAKKPLSLSRGQYWLARSYEAKGDQNKATQFYNQAAKYSYSFYGQLANIELKKNHIILPKNPGRSKSNDNEVVRAIKYLVTYNQPDLGLIYAKDAIEKSLKPLEIALITEIMGPNCSIYHKVELAKVACQCHTFIKNHAFPTPYMSVVQKAPIETALVYSIIRQESVFNQYAVSTAKARGLMQLIEQTACDTAKAIRHKCDIRKLTLDPDYNIKLGSNYLKEMLQQFNNSYLLAIISYNAGPRNVNKWIDLFGDPRNLKSLRQIIDWIELIPYSETRNYAQRVLENLQVYRAILSNNTNLKLKQDLISRNSQN